MGVVSGADVSGVRFAVATGLLGPSTSCQSRWSAAPFKISSMASTLLSTRRVSNHNSWPTISFVASTAFYEGGRAGAPNPSVREVPRGVIPLRRPLAIVRRHHQGADVVRVLVDAADRGGDRVEVGFADDAVRGGLVEL